MKWVRTIFLILFSLPVKGQDKIVTSGRYIPSGKNDNQYILARTLYTSCYNTILVTVKDVPCDHIESKSDSLDIIKQRGFDRGHFYVKVLGHPHKVFARVYVQNKLLDSISFVILKDIPQIYVRPCNEFRWWDGMRYAPYELSCVKIFDEHELNLHSKDSLIWFKVLSFTATIEVDNKVIFEEKTEGDTFTPAFNAAWMKNIKKGRLTIKSITVRDEENGNIYTKLNQYSRFSFFHYN